MVMVLGKEGGRRLLSVTAVIAVIAFVLLAFSGCGTAPNKAAAEPIASPSPSASATASSGTLTAALKPEGANTTGSGTASLRLNTEQQEICYVIHVSGIGLPATAAHIHHGAAGVSGPDVVSLTPPNTEGVAQGCTHASHDLVASIAKHPANYYVNVHNAQYPEGAVRGQLAPCNPETGC